jgi:flagellar basal body P-ring formation protein FlgA
MIIAKRAAWVSILISLVVGGAGGGFAQTSSDLVVVARLTIYPGDLITAEMLDDRRLAVRAGTVLPAFATRQQLVGKLAKRTLLPGQGIAVGAVRDPDAVRSGRSVALVFAAGELVITGRGLALQAGAVGDVISIQNSDSLVVVRGTIQGDGSVRIEE